MKKITILLTFVCLQIFLQLGAMDAPVATLLDSTDATTRLLAPAAPAVRDVTPVDSDDADSQPNQKRRRTKLETKSEVVMEPRDLGHGLVIFPHSAWPKEDQHELLLPSGKSITYFMHEQRQTKDFVPATGEKNVFSTCLFRPKTERNARASEYVAGLLESCEKLLEDFPGWILRIYFDASLVASEPKNEAREIWIPLLQKLTQKPNVQLIQYYFPDFAEKDDAFHHQGLFGMFVRFMAAFDTNVTRMFSWDADSKMTPELKHMILEEWMREHADKDILFPRCDEYKPLWDKFTTAPFCVLGGYWGAKQQHDTLLLGQLFDALLGNNADIHALLLDGCDNVCSFGFDELLLNKILAPAFLEKAFVYKFSLTCQTVVPRHVAPGTGIILAFLFKFNLVIGRSQMTIEQLEQLCERLIVESPATIRTAARTFLNIKHLPLSTLLESFPKQFTTEKVLTKESSINSMLEIGKGLGLEPIDRTLSLGIFNEVYVATIIMVKPDQLFRCDDVLSGLIKET